MSGFYFIANDLALDLANTLGIVDLAPHVLTKAFVIKTVAFGMGVIGSAIWNFTLNKLWAFKND